MLVLLAHSGRRAIAVAHEVAPAAPAKLAACRDLYDVEGLVGLGEALPQLVDLPLLQVHLQHGRVVRHLHHQRRQGVVASAIGLGVLCFYRRFALLLRGGRALDEDREDVIEALARYASGR